MSFAKSRLDLAIPFFIFSCSSLMLFLFCRRLSDICLLRSSWGFTVGSNLPAGDFRPDSWCSSVMEFSRPRSVSSWAFSIGCETSSPKKTCRKKKRCCEFLVEIMPKVMKCCLHFIQKVLYRGGFKIFSMVRSVFQKIFENFVDFFQVDQIDFPSPPKTLKRLSYSKKNCAASQLLKKYAKKYKSKLA